MYKCINGWSKTSMIEFIKANFKGKSIVTDDDGYERCAYRGANGRKCAVGLFIPDNEYRVDMDNKNYSCGATSIIAKYKLRQFMPLRSDAMGSLQINHDSSTPEHTLDSMIAWVNNNVE